MNGGERSRDISRRVETEYCVNKPIRGNVIRCFCKAIQNYISAVSVGGGSVTGGE